MVRRLVRQRSRHRVNDDVKIGIGAMKHGLSLIINKQVGHPNPKYTHPDTFGLPEISVHNVQLGMSPSIS
jgi:hypothetical protein